MTKTRRFAEAIDWVLEPDLATPIEQQQRWSEREHRRVRQSNERDLSERDEITTDRTILGRLAAALTRRSSAAELPPSQQAAIPPDDTHITEILDRCNSVVTFHHRRLPGMGASIDHIAVMDDRVIVIYCIRGQGRIQARDVGWLLRPETRLYVGKQDNTTLIHTVAQQGAALATALRSTRFAEHPVHGVLCFLDARWPRVYRRPLTVNAVTCVWPSGLEDLLRPASVRRLPTLPRTLARTNAPVR